MPYLIGACCTDQIIGGNDVSGLLAINETIPFSNLATYTLAWNGTRIAKYGLTGSFKVVITGTDGINRDTPVEIIPDNLDNPTSYHFDFGGVSSGVITIS